MFRMMTLKQTFSFFVSRMNILSFSCLLLIKKIAIFIESATLIYNSVPPLNRYSGITRHSLSSYLSQFYLNIVCTYIWVFRWVLSRLKKINMIATFMMLNKSHCWKCLVTYLFTCLQSWTLSGISEISHHTRI